MRERSTVLLLAIMNRGGTYFNRYLSVVPTSAFPRTDNFLHPRPRLRCSPHDVSTPSSVTFPRAKDGMDGRLLTCRCRCRCPTRGPHPEHGGLGITLWPVYCVMGPHLCLVFLPFAGIAARKNWWRQHRQRTL